MSKVYLSIGSNKGNRSVLINKAIDEIEKKIGKIISRTSIYQSRSWGFDSNDFYNLSLLIDTDIEPKSLLINLKKIEKSMGREDIDGSYSDRFIDIDILFYDNIITDSEELKIPQSIMSDDEIILESDQVLEIPQVGTKHSLNVSVAAGIILWDFYQKTEI